MGLKLPDIDNVVAIDIPVITPDRWLSDFAKLDIRDEIRPKVLKTNARKLLNI